MSPRSTLVLGGARSGKSRHAEELAAAWPGRKFYIATAEAGDREMAERIALHRVRRGDSWTTVECPLDLVTALEDRSRSDAYILVDCITLWISNLMLAGGATAAAVDELCAAMPRLAGRLVFVSNEVGLGIVPDSALGRAFRDAAGLANQQLASAVDEVVFMAAGLPLRLK